MLLYGFCKDSEEKNKEKGSLDHAMYMLIERPKMG
jgi:hypothetical protein